MTQLVFFLEEPSAREMLQGVLPRLLPVDVETKFVVFEGKQDLEKRLPIRLRAWQRTDARFVVMRDQDSGDCVAIKQQLIQKCREAGKPEALVRIACRELETFYLGDLKAVAQSIGKICKDNKTRPSFAIQTDWAIQPRSLKNISVLPKGFRLQSHWATP